MISKKMNTVNEKARQVILKLKIADRADDAKDIQDIVDLYNKEYTRQIRRYECLVGVLRDTLTKDDLHQLWGIYMERLDSQGINF